MNLIKHYTNDLLQLFYSVGTWDNLQGVPSSDDNPAGGGGHAGDHVELQEVQRLIHGAVPRLLQAVMLRETTTTSSIPYIAAIS